MNVLITGARGFVGKNLTAALENLRDGKDRTRPGLEIEKLWLFDVDSPEELLDEACREADFVFHLAGVIRPKDPSEFTQGNVDFSAKLIEKLSRAENRCPVAVTSSVQATLLGRYDNDYGRSKKTGEELFFDYGRRTGAEVLVYRLPNLFGKWCRPNYNSVVATFCHNIANGLPITVNDPGATLELLYIDDLVSSLLDAAGGRTVRCDYEGLDPVIRAEGRFCCVPVTHRVTLGEIADLLYSFDAQPKTLTLPRMSPGSFEKKLCSTYLSYLPEEKVAFPLKMNADARGSFTELFRTEGSGQISVNVSLPGITKGQHWHHTKWEFFVVVSGRGLMQQRRIGSEEVIETFVSGDRLEAVRMLPGYTHNLINLSETENLVTVMWANECVDPDHPDTFFEKV